MTFASLDEIAEVISKGTTPTSVGLNFSSSGVPFIRGENVVGTAIELAKVSTFLDADAHAALARSTLKQGDVLVTIAGTIGRIGFLETNEVANCNQAVAFVRCPATLVDAEWLSLLLQTPAYQAHFSAFVAGGAIPNVSLAQIGSLWIPQIPITEQRRIAARLKAQLAEVDTARQAAQAQVRDAELLRQRLLRHTFDTLHDVPRKVLGDWAKTTSGSTPSRGDKRYWSPAEIPWVKTGEVAFAPISATEEGISRQALAECSLTLLPPQSVLIAMYGQGKTRGQSAILGIEATTNQACFAILPNHTWDAQFLHYWLMASYEALRGLSDGRGGNQANLNGGLLNALKVPAPDIDDQRRIVARLQAQLAEADAIAQAATAQLADIEHLPQRLLVRAFES